MPLLFEADASVEELWFLVSRAHSGRGGIFATLYLLPVNEQGRQALVCEKLPLSRRAAGRRAGRQRIRSSGR